MRNDKTTDSCQTNMSPKHYIERSKQQKMNFEKLLEGKSTSNPLICSSDNEPPRIYCPQNQEVKKENSQLTIKVYWDPPTSSDNSGQEVKIFSESINGSDFRTGQHQVKYDATDHVGNKASCTFIIVVSSK